MIADRTDPTLEAAGAQPRPAHAAPAVLAIGFEPPASPGPASPRPEAAANRGRELFERSWVKNDPRGHGGDGLGPVFNGRSCVDCHNQGGSGGAGGADRNIEIATVTEEPTWGGYSYAMSMDFATGRFEYRMGLPQPASGGGPRTDPRLLARSIPASAGRGAWCCTTTGPTPPTTPGASRCPASTARSRSRAHERNPPPAVRPGPDRRDPRRGDRGGLAAEVRGLGAGQGAGEPPEGRAGRPVRLEGADGDARRVRPLGRGRRDGPRDPRPAPGLRPPPPRCRRAGAGHGRGGMLGPGRPRAGPAGARRDRAGKRRGRRPDQGGRGDLQVDRLHRLPPAAARRRRGDLQRPPPARHGPAAGRFRRIHRVRGRTAPAVAERPGTTATASATAREWRTPPLWGLRDSGPYLHDGRAARIDQAIAQHGGQGAASARRYAELSPRRKRQLEVFLMSLASPPAGH